MNGREPTKSKSILSVLEAFLQQARNRTIGGVLDSLAAARARRDEAAFSIALIALSAKMARADGAATAEEFAAFLRFFDFPAEEGHKVRMIYELAKQDVAGFEHYLARVAALYDDQPAILEDVLDCLYYIATADGVEHPREKAMLDQAAKAFRLSSAAARRLRAAHFGLGKDDPFAVLGLAPDASPALVKGAYRALMRDNHPDALIARGVPPALIKIAEARSAAINDAYEKALALASS